MLVLLTALISGVSTFVNGYAVQGTNSDAFVTVRNLAVTALLVPLAVLGGRAAVAPPGRAGWAQLALIGLIGGAVPFLLFFHGIALATAAGGAATASFGYRTLFLLATVLGVVVLRERLHGRWLVAAALLLAGNVLLLSLTAPVLTDGTLFVLAATALWAVEYTLSKRLLRDLPSTTVGLGRMGFGGMFLAGYLLVTAQWGAVPSFSAGQWGWVAISAVLLAAFVTSWYAGLKHVDLGVATSALVLGFPITWALTLALRGGPLLLSEALGAAAIVLGVGVALGLTSLRGMGTRVAVALGLNRRSAS